jgi:CRP-like cAMP-binding protein
MGETEMQHEVGVLGGIGLFAGLGPEAIDVIARQCRWRRFDAGAQVFDAGNDTLDVYFVISGMVRILTNGPDNREVALADIGEGQYFGELAAIDGMKRSAQVVATMDTVLASMDGPTFLALLRRHPELALRVLDRLTRIIRNLDTRVTELSTQGESQRIYEQLLRLARPDPTTPQSWIIDDLPNHKEIAAWSGTSREAVAQAIGELSRNGVVRRRGMGLMVFDWPRLSRLAAANG